MYIRRVRWNTGVQRHRTLTHCARGDDFRADQIKKRPVCADFIALPPRVSIMAAGERATKRRMHHRVNQHQIIFIRTPPAATFEMQNENFALC
jgi:hypothetical protein